MGRAQGLNFTHGPQRLRAVSVALYRVRQAAQRPAEQMIDWTPERGTAAPITVTVTRRAEMLADLETRLAQGRGFTLATLNLDHVVKFRRDPRFLEAYRAHSHVTADGNPIVWLSRMAGHDIELIPGSELIEDTAACAARCGVSVALLGSTQESLEAAASHLKAQVPGLEVALCFAPPMGFEPDGPTGQAAIAALQQSGAGLCFLALGAPKQECFAHIASQSLPQMGFVSIGAGLDFLAGTQTRAPTLVRRLALEWLWRLLGNPRRLAARYGACIAVLPGLTLRALAHRRLDRQQPE